MLEAELKDLIAKHLPQQVGEALKQRLADADRDKSLLVNTTKDLEQAKKQLEDAQWQVRRAGNLDTREKELRVLELQLESEKRALDLTVTQIRLEQAEKRADMVMEFTRVLVKSPEVKTSVFGTNGAVGGIVRNNGYDSVQSVPSPVSYTETKTTE